MRVIAIFTICILSYVICEHVPPKYLKPFPKKAKSQSLILNPKKYVNPKLTEIKPRTKKHPPQNTGYTVFPPLGVDQEHSNIPHSPYFPVEPQTDQKPRVKKVLTDYSVRNKRSADIEKSKDGDKTTKTHAKLVKSTDGKVESSKKTRKNSNVEKKRKHRKGTKSRSSKKASKKSKSKGKKQRRERKEHKTEIEVEYKSKKTGKERKDKQTPTAREHIKKPPKTKSVPQLNVPGRHQYKKVNATRRLIAARDALIEDYPYVVSIQKERQHWCAGALLNQRMAITTANCIWKANRVSRLRVRAGSRHPDRGGQMAKIQEVMKHPGWSIRRNPDNDVALIYLDRLIRFSDSVHGVDLPNQVMLPPFDDAWVTSWGAARRDGVFEPKGMTLQVYHARLMDRKKCNNVTQRFGVAVTENFICLAQTGRRAPCTRDTGAPAVSDGVLWGLASWGIRRLCGTERFPAMFSYLASKSNLGFITNATHYLMSDQRFYPFGDRYPLGLLSTTTTTPVTAPYKK